MDYRAKTLLDEGIAELNKGMQILNEGGRKN